MKRLTLSLCLIATVVLGAGISVTPGAQRAFAWLLRDSTGDTITSSQNGIGWADGKLTLRAAPGALQFSTTGSPPEPVMTWSGRIVAQHIDVTSMSLFASVPATSSSPGTAGQMAYDGSYFYVCTALNTWKRSALSSW